MGGLRQEIQQFREGLVPTLEKILERHGRGASGRRYRTIALPCRRLMQKCSFKSLLDASALCALAYWLYIEGEGALALELCEHTHGVDFAWEPSWRGGCPAICGLEIRIARELLQEDRKSQIPRSLLGYYFSKSVRKGLRYPQVLREDAIKGCQGRLLEQELLGALYDMVGMGETGLYPELNENWAEIEEAVCLYVDCLKSGLSEE